MDPLIVAVGSLGSAELLIVALGGILPLLSLVLLVLAIKDLARRADPWGAWETISVVVLVLGGPITSGAYLLVTLLVRGRGRGRERGTAPDGRRVVRVHPLLRHVEDLRQPYDVGSRDVYDPVELVRWALADLQDEWAGRAMRWLEDGLPSDRVTQELAVIAGDPRRPMPLRQRAVRLLEVGITSEERSVR